MSEKRIESDQKNRRSHPVVDLRELRPEAEEVHLAQLGPPEERRDELVREASRGRRVAVRLSVRRRNDGVRVADDAQEEDLE